MKRLKLSLFMPCLLLLIAACTGISTGYVTGKTHTEQYSYVQMICAGFNSKGVCTVWVPHTVVVPEKWRLELKNGDDAGWVYVSEATYEAIEVGDMFNGEDKQ